MIDVDGLIEVARQLNAGMAGASPTPEAVRRAVSTAYYALFHALLKQAADRFIGIGNTAAAYEIIYRAFDHRQVREILEAIDRPTLAAKYSRSLRRTSVSRELRDFTSVFVPTQRLRHFADYSPSIAISQSEAEGLIDDVASALGFWHAASSDEKTDLLALMLSGAR